MGKQDSGKGRQVQFARWSLRFLSTSKWRGQIGSELFKNEKSGVVVDM